MGKALPSWGVQGPKPWEVSEAPAVAIFAPSTFGALLPLHLDLSVKNKIGYHPQYVYVAACCHSYCRCIFIFIHIAVIHIHIVRVFCSMLSSKLCRQGVHSVHGKGWNTCVLPQLHHEITINKPENRLSRPANQ
jgi:hypothetical protein